MLHNDLHQISSRRSHNFERCLDQAKVFTRTFIESAVKILNQYDINKDISVWAQLLLKDGEVNVLGHTRYEAKTHTFHDFERYELKPIK